MCDLDLEPCEIWNEKKRKAQKSHECDCCGRMIRPGEIYLVHFSVYDGDTTSEKVCAECWQQWVQQQIRVINHYGLRPALKEDRERLYGFTREFLNLPG